MFWKNIFKCKYKEGIRGICKLKKKFYLHKCDMLRILARNVPFSSRKIKYFINNSNDSKKALYYIKINTSKENRNYSITLLI